MSTHDWPHDPDGEEGSEGRRKYGHAVLVKKIDEEDDFPLRAGDYADEFGDHPVRLDADTVVSVADIFAGIDDDAEYDDIVAFHKAVGAAMREQGYWTYEGADAFVR
ncbi:hypothetical protein HUG10_04335 [Halorarum halophilum]|uniref:Uncharacterized protein n=1 Tax=Halorarum halophilum TaxID=2743090 RepID=A0A7D5KKP0_9EURY|nr:DUF5785 family protein [Halobaculum halophilum]QLG26815.1 hypothetical protein HUG10_04335 [Halobaculum halophilum]